MEPSVTRIKWIPVSTASVWYAPLAIIPAQMPVENLKIKMFFRGYLWKLMLIQELFVLAGGL